MTIGEMLVQAGISAGSEQEKKLVEYNALIQAMNKKVNLTGIRDSEESLVKNVYDSLSVYDPSWFPKEGRVLDLGTGGGFPGAILAILRPDMQFMLMDSVLKKLNCVEEACQKLGLHNVKCVHMRAEEGGRRRKTRESFDVVTARAVKALPVLCEWAIPFLKTGGVFCAMKGPSAMDELAQSGRILRELVSEVAEKKEITLPNGDRRIILYIQKNGACPKIYPRKVGVAEKNPILGA